jgi:hypothetical protein
MHPTAERLAIVAWKSPMKGAVRVQGSFVDLDPNCGNGIRWSIDRAERTLQSDDLPNASAQSFSLPGVQVSEHDVLYFIVDANGDYACDSTALDLTISQAGRHLSAW